MEHIETAEDIASETFTAALETWPHKGKPENPVACLYTVAKNKTRNHLKRDNTFTKKVTGGIKHLQTGKMEISVDLSDKNITDSQLQMLFVV